MVTFIVWFFIILFVLAALKEPLSMPWAKPATKGMKNAMIREHYKKTRQ